MDDKNEREAVVERNVPLIYGTVFVICVCLCV